MHTASQELRVDKAEFLRSQLSAAYASSLNTTSAMARDAAVIAATPVGGEDKEQLLSLLRNQDNRERALVEEHKLQMADLRNQVSQTHSGWFLSVRDLSGWDLSDCTWTAFSSFLTPSLYILS